MFVLWQEVTWSFCNLPFLSNAGLRVGIPKGDCGIHRNIKQGNPLYVFTQLRKWGSVVKFKRVSERSGKLLHAPRRLSDFSVMLQQKQFQCLSDWSWSCRPLFEMVHHCSVYSSPPPGYQMRDVISLISRASRGPQHFRPSEMQAACLQSTFLISLDSSTPCIVALQVFENGDQTLLHANLDFPFPLVTIWGKIIESVRMMACAV